MRGLRGASLKCRHEWPAPPCGNTTTKLLLANLNAAAVCAEADIGTAFADGGARGGVAALVIDVDAEIVYVNVAVRALRIHAEACFPRQIKFDTAVSVADIDISQGRFRSDRDHAVAVFHFTFTADIFEVHFIGAGDQLDRPGKGAGAQVAMAHGNFTIELGELQVRAD